MPVSVDCTLDQIKTVWLANIYRKQTNTKTESIIPCIISFGFLLPLRHGHVINYWRRVVHQNWLYIKSWYKRELFFFLFFSFSFFFVFSFLFLVLFFDFPYTLSISLLLSLNWQLVALLIYPHRPSLYNVLLIFNYVYVYNIHKSMKMMMLIIHCL